MEKGYGSPLGAWPERNYERALFLRWLEQTTSEEPWVLSIHDEGSNAHAHPRGGCGKSWLLHDWVTLARQRFPHLPIVQIDGLQAADHDCLVITQRVVTHLQAAYAPWQAQTFAQTLAALSARDSLRAARSLHELPDARLREQLWAALARDLQTLQPLLPARKPTLLLVYDSFELLAANPQLTVLNPGQPFPERFGLPRVKVLIASRQPLDWCQPLWRGREREVRSLALPPWSAEDIQRALEREGLISPTDGPPVFLCERLATLTGGSPALVRLTCNLLAQSHLPPAELARLEQDAFDERLAAWLIAPERPLAWWLLVLAHLIPGPNEPGVALDWLAGLLAHLPSDPRLEPASTEAALREELRSLSAVRMSSDMKCVALSKEIRWLLLQYGWERQDPDRRFRREVSRAVMRLCERELQARRELAGPVWQTYQTLLLFHCLNVDLERGWRLGERLLVSTLARHQHGLASRLLEILRRFERELAPYQRRQLSHWEEALWLPSHSQEAEPA